MNNTLKREESQLRASEQVDLHAVFSLHLTVAVVVTGCLSSYLDFPLMMNCNMEL